MSRPQAPRSLQARLLTLLLALLCAVWLVTALMTWIDARHELDELLDSHLAQAAALLVVQQTRAEDDDVADVPMLHKYALKVAFQVFHEGQLVMRSPNVDPTPLATINAGFSTVQRDDGSTWRVFATRGAADDVQVYVAEQDDSRSDILQAVLRSVLLPPLFALPLLALLIWWAVRRELKPLSQLSRQLKGRDGRQAQALAPLPLDQLPMEIHPVVEALNGLFQRLDQMLSAEQRFTADAAHELRTPIAAIRAQAQVAQGAGSDHAQRERALQATLAGCDRASRLVDQLLTLARLEADPSGAATSDAERPVDLRAVAQRTAAELAPAALARQQDLALDAASAALVPGPELLIGVLLRNLLDNALRYSPTGAQITMQIDSEAGHTVLSVEDSGAGLSEPEMARLGERFYRVAGQAQPGSGLGWSIVRRIAQATGAQLQLGLSERLGGLAVTVRWPTPLKP
jgi:two-component system sensor histidine kinase QseC